jgi:xylulokinase
VLGIRPGTTRFDLYKAVLEGIAYEFATMAELLEQVVGSFDEVYVAGGGTRSTLGLELRAAFASRPLHVMQSSEAVCLGTAILAGIAIGEYSGIGEAVQHVTAVKETVRPAPMLKAQYARSLEQYRLLYSSLEPVRQAQAAAHSGGNL